MLPFDPIKFKLDFPEFNSLSDSYLTDTFTYVVGEIGKVIWGLFVCNSPMQYYWATIVLAHVLTLMNGQNGDQNGIGKVGIITGATEGSVSANFNVPATPSSWWWLQTPFGAMAYTLLQQRGGATYWAQGSYNGYAVEGYNDGYCGSSGWCGP